MIFFFLNLLNDLVFRQGNEQGDYARTLDVTTERSDLMHRHSESLREMVVLRSTSYYMFLTSAAHAARMIMFVCFVIIIFFTNTVIQFVRSQPIPYPPRSTG